MNREVSLKVMQVINNEQH